MLRSTKGVQVMALPHSTDIVEIGCNLQATQTSASPPTSSILNCIAQHLPASAEIRHSYVVGLTPHDALSIAENGTPTEDLVTLHKY